MSEEKKYPCLYGLKDNCEARKFIEENMTINEKDSPVARALPKDIGKTHILQFDDENTAEKMGRAAAEGGIGVIAASMAPLKPQFMITYCSMCPTRIHSIEEICRKCREQPHTEKVTTPFSDKKHES